MHRGIHLGKASLIQKSSTQILASAKDPLQHLERCTGTPAHPASARSASANSSAGGKHPRLALEELTLLAETLRSTAVLRRGREEGSPKGLPWASGIQQNSFANTEQGLLKIPCFLSNTFTAKAFYKHYTGSIITKSPGG